MVLSDAIIADPIHRELYEQLKQDDGLRERMLPLRNIVQILLLHCNSVDKYLVVANTHLYSQRNAESIRLLQTAIILNQIQSVIENTIVEHKLDEQQISAIFCGDLNSVPSDPIHQLITHGSVLCKSTYFLSCRLKLRSNSCYLFFQLSQRIRF